MSMDIIGLAGSLRQTSYRRALLRATQALVPRLSDGKTKAYLKRTLEALAAWAHITYKLQRAGG